VVTKDFMKKIILISVVFCFSVVAFRASAQVRKPAVAGQFYPADKAQLQEMINFFLESAEPSGLPANANSRLIGVIVPHAGYLYSGQVAAYAYKLLGTVTFISVPITVIIAGPSHRFALDKIAIYPSGTWETPLGKVKVDTVAAGMLMNRSAMMQELEQAHATEHSLEVQVPFLQTVLKDFMIVPLVLGYPPNITADALTNAIIDSGLYKRLGKDLILIASSDMSHYHPYASACMMDGACLTDIGSLDINTYKDNASRGSTEMCGSGPVLALLQIAKKLGAKAKVLKYANSGDVPAGDKASVVGYCAVVFYTDTNVVAELALPKNSSGATFRRTVEEKGGVKMLTDAQKKRLLQIARQTLEQYIRSKKVPEITETDPVLTEKRGGFVTLTKNGQLRGCIGYIQPVLPLYQTVSKMAIEASTADPRFPEVQANELKDIHIEISALTPIELLKDVNKIEVGKHGLIIKKGFNQGLLLPQVATDYGWDKWQFLDQTCVKAGLPPGSWKDKDAQIFVFSAEVFGE